MSPAGDGLSHRAIHLSACCLVIVAACLVVATACQREGSLQVRGQVIEVAARNFSELEHLRIRDAKGREYAFTTDGFVGFTPSHVREHQILGQSLLVSYEKRGDVLVAVWLED